MVLMVVERSDCLYVNGKRRSALGAGGWKRSVPAVSPSNDSAGPFSGPATPWDALPPKRQRFYLWALLWWLLGGFLSIPLQLIGIPYLLAALIVLGLAALHLFPLGRAAWQEFQQRRASGEEPPPKPVSTGALVGWVVATIVLWTLFGVLVPMTDELAIPVIPIVVTIVAVLRFRRWRAQRTSPDEGAQPSV